MRLFDYENKQVRITTISGRIFEGVAKDYTSELDNPDGVACISIGNIEFEEGEIKLIELVSTETHFAQAV